MRKQNNEYSLNNTDQSQGKWFCFATIAREISYGIAKISIFNKLNQHAWVTVGENDFVITTVGMRVNQSLLVWNL